MDGVKKSIRTSLGGGLQMWQDEMPCMSSVKSEFRVKSFDLFRKEEEEGVPVGHRMIQSTEENEQR